MLWSDFESSLSDENPDDELIYAVLELVCDALVTQSSSADHAKQELARVADLVRDALLSHDALERIDKRWKMREKIESRRGPLSRS